MKPELTLSLTVTDRNLKTGTVNDDYNDDLKNHITVTTNGSFTWSATGLPSGLTLAPATGLITGTPSVAVGR